MAVTFSPNTRSTRAAVSAPSKPATAYARLEDRLLSRDQLGASEVYYGLAKSGRPLKEMVRETVRIYAPYTHVPFHQRMQDGVVRFVNNEHVFLSLRVSLRLANLMPQPLRHLPMAQTVWYVPTGLDPWNQLVGKAPGHYAAAFPKETVGNLAPQVHFADQDPLRYPGLSYQERLDLWLTQVQVGDQVGAYRTFLGMAEDADATTRPRLLSQLVFAGLIDLQDQQTFRRSYTTGHKAYRAHATVELAEGMGWNDVEGVHHVLYAGVPDMAVGPHWYSNYDMAGNVCQMFFQGQEAAFRGNTAGLTPEESAATIEAVLRGDEPTAIRQVVALLKDGKGPRQILDVLQIAASELLLEAAAITAYSQPMHAVEYCHTLRWFYENFDHPHQVKLLFVAAAYVNDTARHQAQMPCGNGPDQARAALSAPRGTTSLPPAEILGRLNKALFALMPEESASLAAAYLATTGDRAALVELLAIACATFGNDPHNQEVALSALEDYQCSSAVNRERLLPGVAKFLAGYRKFGEPLESYRHYAEAFGVDAKGQQSRGDAPAEDAVNDDD